MARNPPVSLKAFHEELESQLGALSADDLRELIRLQARAQLPEQRRSFLDHLQPAQAANAGLEGELRGDALIKEIADLKKEIRKAMAEPPEPEYSHSWDDRYDDEDDDGSGVYEHFTWAMSGFFDRAQAAYETGRKELARDAYAALFGLLALQDDYGRSVQPPETVDRSEVRARYFRALCETTRLEARARRLWQAVQATDEQPFGAGDFHLGQLLEIDPAPLPDCDALLDALVRLLSTESDYSADRLLREAVRLRTGAEGLAALARAEGNRRPHAWIAWLESVASAGDAALLQASAREALAALPNGLSLRAQAADFWRKSAIRLGDRPEALAACWEALRVNPVPSRLLDLWETAQEATVQHRWMQKTLEWVTASRNGPRKEGRSAETRDHELILGPEARFDDPVEPRVPVCAALLAGDWQRVFAAAAKEPALGWSSGDSAQALVLPVIMAWLAGWPARELPDHLSNALAEATDRVDGWEEPTPDTSTRLRAALTAGASTWEKPVEPAALIKSCIQLVVRRVDAIVEGLHRGAYERAAMLAVAAAELQRITSTPSAAVALLDALRVRHNRKSAFKKELLRHRHSAGL